MPRQRCLRCSSATGCSSIHRPASQRAPLGTGRQPSNTAPHGTGKPTEATLSQQPTLRRPPLQQRRICCKRLQIDLGRTNATGNLRYVTAFLTAFDCHPARPNPHKRRSTRSRVSKEAMTPLTNLTLRIEYSRALVRQKTNLRQCRSCWPKALQLEAERA